MDRTTVNLGGSPEFSLVLLNEASAYPHGFLAVQTIREGSTILMDCGCSVEGYQSDISRTWVFGSASARQRKVWSTVRRGQEIALETAKIGTSVGSIDDAVRGYYEREGWGPGVQAAWTVASHRPWHRTRRHEPAYWCMAIQPPCKRACAFRTSRESTFRESSAFAWKTVG